MVLKTWSWKSKDPDPKGSILLLHGIAMTGAVWYGLAKHFSERYDVLAPDQRGHGSSMPLSGSNPDEIVTPLVLGGDLADTLLAKGFHPCIVVGHSMAVRSALALTHLKPDWIDGIVLVDLGFEGDSAAGSSLETMALLERLPEFFESKDAAASFLRENQAKKELTKSILGGLVLENGKWLLPFCKRTLINMIAAARNYSTRNWLSDFGMSNKPALVLRGADSNMWLEEKYLLEKAFFGKHPSIRFMQIPDVGHDLPFKMGRGFVELVERFCGSVYRSE